MSTGGNLRYNNTAGRVLVVLEDARRQADGQPALVAWSAVFRLPENETRDPVAIHRHLAAVNDGLREIERDVKELLADEAAELLQDFPTIRKATAPVNLEVNWTQYKQHLGEHAMRSLQFCAVRLPKDADVSPDEVKQVQEAVTSLFEQVRKSNIKKPLKTWLLDRLAAIKQMIDLYWIKGPKVVRDALAALTGEIAVYGQKLEEVKEQDPSVFKRFAEMMNQLLKVAEMVEKFQPLLEYAGPATEIFGRLLAGPN